MKNNKAFIRRYGGYKWECKFPDSDLFYRLMTEFDHKTATQVIAKLEALPANKGIKFFQNNAA